MSIFNRGTKKIEAAFNQKLKAVTLDLRHQMQGYIDAMTLTETSSKYAYNNFREYATACKAVNDKYENKADWGNGLTANIVDFRATVTVSSGPQFKPAKASSIKQKDETGKNIGSEDPAAGDIKPSPDAAPDPALEAEREMEFVRDFFEANDINHEAPQELGRDSEIEGRVAVELVWDETKKQVIVVHKPWITYQYEETRSETNPRVVEKISWPDRGTEIKAGFVNGDRLICRRFSGRLSAKYPVTKIMRCLTQIEAIDQSFRDWREIDRLYASPIPVFECKTPEDAEEFRNEVLHKLNFKLKKAFAIAGTFKYVSPDMTGVDSIEKEIKRLACFISGSTGYPLQFLLPDMLSNRSTSENIMESAMIHTASERAIWIGFYEELISKAMAMYTVKTSKAALDPNKISVTISLMTKEQWDRLTSFWLPAFKDDLITREAALSQIPDFNLSEELQRREEADQEQVARVIAELDKVKREAEQNNSQPGQPPFGKKTPGGKDDLE